MHDVPLHPTTVAVITETWRAVESRYAAYRLVLPGTPTFHCQPHLCDAHCCRAFTVNLGASEVERMQSSSGLAPSRFLESSEGEPVVLPLAQPYILARAENHCALLDASLSCGQYEGRPNACRLYPHFLLFIDAATGRPIHGDLAAIGSAVACLREGRPFDDVVAVPVRHTECPGFTGAPMTGAEWLALVEATFDLQFPGG